MTTPLKISFSDLIAVAVFYHILSTGTWSWWYLVAIIFWGRFHVLRKRLWYSMLSKAREIEAEKKLKKEKNEIN